ncbi:hypothetical protein GQ600_25326 [Phytophthora cactorum]|nr:hypothetical protein GQ600_25326 [Phytophthora cactorum]
MRHCRVREVMHHIIDLVHGAGVLPEGVTNISSMQLAAADKVFDAVFKTMLSQLYTSVPKRSEEITCGTTYNRLCKYQHAQKHKQSKPVQILTTPSSVNTV